MPAIVVITGASTGIGRLATETVARAGHTVFASMRDLFTRNSDAAESLAKLARVENLPIFALQMDVCDSASVQNAVDEVVQRAGRLDVVVNNAGIMSIGLAEGFTEEQAARQMDVNFMGSFRVARAALPQMRAQHSGLLIHVTSVAGRIVLPGCALYCASKFAQEAMGEVLHYELAGTGVESVMVEPGPYPSQLVRNSPAPADSERVAAYGALAGLREAFTTHFGDLFRSAESPNTQEVADAILRLIELPAGERPLRTVCGIDFGAHTVNQQVAPIQADVLRELGMGHAAVVKASEKAKRAAAA